MQLEQIFYRILNLSEREKKPVLFKMVKVQEETGELSEATLFAQGYLPHKTMKEPLAGEVADVIICALNVLKASYPHLSNEELLGLLNHQFEIKSDKWEGIIANEEKSS